MTFISDITLNPEYRFITDRLALTGLTPDQAIDQAIRSAFAVNDATIRTWMTNGEKGRIWQDGPMGELWIDDSVDVISERIIYQHPEGMREQFRGTTPWGIMGLEAQ